MRELFLHRDACGKHERCAVDPAEACVYRGTSLISPPPLPLKDHLRNLGMVLLYGLRRRHFLVREIPVQGLGL